MTAIAEENDEHSHPKESTPIDESASLECNFPGCPEKSAFPNRSALKYFFLCRQVGLCLHCYRRHEDKHVRPYICKHPSCNHKSFGDKGGLDRHQREVHSSEAYTCPVLSCPRSKKGFNRPYNLLQHQKRKHRLQPSSFLRVRPDTLEQLSGSEDGSQTLHCKDDIIESIEDDVEGTAPAPGGCNAVGETSLRSKLRDLQVLRARVVEDIDEDIMSLRRALHIMGATSQ
jgi:hypothetical protein